MGTYSFNIFITTRRDPYDGDDGYNEQIELSMDKVLSDIADMVYNDFILCAMPLKSEYEIDTDKIVEQIKKLIEEMDLLDKCVEYYRDELTEIYSEEYGSE